jgi:DNA-binding GntR family transcriptional regulator
VATSISSDLGIGALDGAALVRERRTTQELVFEFLRDAILSGRLRGGSHLVQDRIATELNVSRVPVREALLQLESEGLVRMEAHRGASVVWLSPEQIQEIFEIRCILISAAIRLVVPGLSDDQLARLEQVAESWDTETSAGARAQLNWAFWGTLFEGLQRPRLLATIEKLRREVERYVSALPNRPHVRRREFLEALRGRDAEEAVRQLAGHLNRVCALAVAGAHEMR